MVLTGRAALLAALGALVVGFAVPCVTGVQVVTGFTARYVRSGCTGPATERFGSASPPGSPCI